MNNGKNGHNEKDPGTGYNKARDPGTEHQIGHVPKKRAAKISISEPVTASKVITMRWEH